MKEAEEGTRPRSTPTMNPRLPRILTSSSSRNNSKKTKEYVRQQTANLLYQLPSMLDHVFLRGGNLHMCKP